MAHASVQTDGAPQAIGPYSQAVKAGGLVFCSGQIPLTPQGELISSTIQEETQQVMRNLEAVLQAAGCDFSDVVRATIFLTDLGDFAAVNEVYGAHFPNNPPARACVQVAALPKGVRVEIDVIAVSA